MQNKAEQYLNQAIKDMESRASERDASDGERSMSRTVNAFNAMHGTSLTEVQGWQFMELLKMARSIGGSFRADDFIDAAAYAALAGEAARREVGFHNHNISSGPVKVSVERAVNACEMKNGEFALRIGCKYRIESYPNNGTATLRIDAVYLGQMHSVSVSSLWDNWARSSDNAIFCLERSSTSVYLY